MNELDFSKTNLTEEQQENFNDLLNKLLNKENIEKTFDYFVKEKILNENGTVNVDWYFNYCKFTYQN
jgi:hypothetical protein